jgi:ATP-dependent exoDNAse (exonuclease V) beta subunit
MQEDEPDKIEFDWAGERIRHVGTVVHEMLQIITEKGEKSWSKLEKSQGIEALVLNLLNQSGLSTEEVPKAKETVFQALKNTLADPIGAWILSGHPEAKNEYPISGIIKDKLVNGIIDRTFIDSQGIRWIIDYKTSSHLGGGLEEFLDREVERYSNQLRLYAKIMQMKEKRSLRLGLYFPLLQAWREVET